MNPTSNEVRVLRELERGPNHVKALARRLGLSVNTVGSAIGRLVLRNAIVRIGTAADAGRTDAPPGQAMWAVRGTPPLPRRAPAERDLSVAQPVKIGRGAAMWGREEA